MIKFIDIECDPDKVFFTSDLHWAHKNISQDSTWDRTSNEDNLRPWNLETMNKRIIEIINDTVPYDGVLIHAGDWSFGGEQNITKLLESIAVDRVISCTGNHDHHQMREGWTKYGFDPLSDHTLYLKIGHQDIVFNHYAMRVWHWAHKGAWMLYGHSHGTLPDDPSLKSIDIGFDTHIHGHERYTLYSFEEIRNIMKAKGEFTPVDHHRPENPC